MTGLDIEAVNQTLDSSDNISFSDAGVPAVQLFTGPHLDYHRLSDTADKIDAEGLVKVGLAVKEVIEYLAAREGPLTTGQYTRGAADRPQGEGRKVSIGTVPDFAYTGKGFRLSGIVPGSPAEAAGLKEGDIITGIDASEVKSLKDFSDILKSLSPGTRVTVRFVRDGVEMAVQVAVVER